MKRTGAVLSRILLILAVVSVANPAFAVRIKIATKTPENFKSARLVKQMTREIEEKTGVPMVSVTYDGTGGAKNEVILPYLEYPRARGGAARRA